MRRNFLVALSFANLCYLRIWSELLTYSRADMYTMVTPPKPVDYFAVMANVVLMALILWGLGILAGRVLKGGSNRLAEMAVLAGLVLPLNGLRAILSNQFPYLKSPILVLLGVHGAMALGICLLVGGSVVIFLFHRKLAAATFAVLAALSPFCAVTFAQAAWRAAHYDTRNYVNKAPLPLLAGAPGSPRVLWFIADEWDYRLTFVDRDPTLSLPELDRLRRESFHAADAIPPGPETPLSIPGYYSERLFNRAIWDGPLELRLMPVDSPGQWLSWSAQSNVFQRARDLGVNAALVEWFHPTCRLLSGMSYCSWRPMARQYNSMGDTFWVILPNQTRSLMETNMFSLFGRSLPSDQQTEVYHGIMREAEALSADMRYAFTVVHLPVPHAPHAYNRKTGDFTLGNAPISGYVDSLALLDRTVGEIRRTMEKAGTWDSTTVLFTTDHPYREADQLDGKSDPRIPYLLKLAGEKQGAEYQPKFNTVLTADLALAILRGEVSDAASVASWLDRNRSRFPTSW